MPPAKVFSSENAITEYCLNHSLGGGGGYIQ